MSPQSFQLGALGKDYQIALNHVLPAASSPPPA